MADGNKFDGMSTDELEAELEKRKLPAAPKPVKTPDWGVVIKMCGEYINSIVKGDPRQDDDFDQYLCGEVMQAIYGGNVFDWINKHTP